MRFRAVAVAVFVSLVPSATASAALSWSRPVSLARGVTLTGVTCQSASLCVAYGTSGRLFVSSHPAGGVATWKLRQIDDAADLKGVSCPSASLCVAYDTAGDVLASRRPLRGASTWKRTVVDDALDSLTCPSRSLCIGVDSIGDVIASTDPARRGSWRRFSIGDRSPTYECVHYQDPTVCAQTSLSGISCPSAGVCSALDQAGNVVMSTPPATEPGDWSVAYVEPPDSTSGLIAVACTSPHFCFGTDNWGNFLASTHPAAGQSAWAATGLGTDGTENSPDSPLDQMIAKTACISRSACIATSVKMNLFATVDPTAQAPRWRPSALHAVTSITCAGHGWCFALVSDGRVYDTHDATRSHSWSHAFRDRAMSDVTARFSCPSAKLCVAVDELGRVAAATVAQRRR